MNARVLNSSYEMILILENDNKGGRTIQNAKFKRGEMSNIIRVGRGASVKEHNAVFNEKLLIELVKSFSLEKSLIYDPFMGSGTVAKICKSLNRNWIGSEISKEYCNLIEKRISNVQSYVFE